VALPRAWHAGQSSDCAGFHLPKMVSGFLLMVTGRRERATRRANEAHEWARKPERASAAFETAAGLHEEVARLHDLAVQHRHGEPAAHRDAARRHREAAQEDRADTERKRKKQRTTKATTRSDPYAPEPPHWEADPALMTFAARHERSFS